MLAKANLRRPTMTIVAELFQEANVISTREVAAALDISESDTRAWADELGVAKIGASYAWSLPDVEALAEALDVEEHEADGEDEEPDEEEEESGDDDEDEDE